MRIDSLALRLLMLTWAPYGKPKIIVRLRRPVGRRREHAYARSYQWTASGSHPAAGNHAVAAASRNAKIACSNVLNASLKWDWAAGALPGRGCYRVGRRLPKNSNMPALPIRRQCRRYPFQIEIDSSASRTITNSSQIRLPTIVEMLDAVCGLVHLANRINEPPVASQLSNAASADDPSSSWCSCTSLSGTWTRFWAISSIGLTTTLSLF